MSQFVEVFLKIFEIDLKDTLWKQIEVAVDFIQLSFDVRSGWGKLSEWRRKTEDLLLERSHIQSASVHYYIELVYLSCWRVHAYFGILLFLSDVCDQSVKMDLKVGTRGAEAQEASSLLLRGVDEFVHESVAFERTVRELLSCLRILGT